MAGLLNLVLGLYVYEHIYIYIKVTWNFGMRWTVVVSVGMAYMNECMYGYEWLVVVSLDYLLPYV